MSYYVPKVNCLRINKLSSYHRHLSLFCIFQLWIDLWVDLRLLSVIRAVKLKRDSTQNVKGRYGRGVHLLRRCVFAKLHCQSPLHRSNVRVFTVFELIRLFVASSASVALTASWRNRLQVWRLGLSIPIWRFNI